VTEPLPLDIRLMNTAAHALFIILGFSLMAVGVWWGLRHATFALTQISVVGEVTHNNAVTLRANVAPKLEGNFFTVDLNATRSAFEAAPWVRRAQVRREFPNRLRVQLQEHQAVAYWSSTGKTDSDERLLNSFGEVFEANTGDVEQPDLPTLGGPDNQSAQVLAMYRVLMPLFTPLDLVLEQLSLSSKGSWQAELDSGALLELGRGSPAELIPRVQRFVQTVTHISSKYGRRASAVESADLRHTDGYALRLRGVTTVNAQEPQSKADTSRKQLPTSQRTKP
jgi:cell division protein FtsQ